MSGFQSDQQSSLVEELRAQLDLKERELVKMKEGAEELHSLKQMNYLLQSKVKYTYPQLMVNQGHILHWWT